MGLYPKVLFALMLLLPGGFVVGPVVLLIKRWRDHRVSTHLLQQHRIVQPVLSAELPREPHAIESQRAAA